MLAQILISLLTTACIRKGSSSTDSIEEEFEVYSKEPHEQNYAYSPDKVCRVRQSNQRLSVSLRNVYNFESTEISGLVAGAEFMSRKSEVINCFQFNSHSYFVSRRNGRTLFSRNGKLRSFAFSLDYTSLRYDPILSRAYLFAPPTLYHFRMDMLERWWGPRDGFRNISTLTTLYHRAFELPDNTSDILLIGRFIYVIIGGRIFKSNFPYPAKWDLEGTMDVQKFPFILFPKIEVGLVGSESSNVSEIGNFKARPWLYFLYACDVLMVILLGYLLAVLSKNYKKQTATDGILTIDLSYSKVEKENRKQ